VREPLEPDAEALLVAVVPDTEDAVIATDLNGLITSWNPGAEDLYGYLAVEMIGESISRIYPEESPTLVGEILDGVRQGKQSLVIGGARRRSDGRFVEVEVQISPIFSASGEVVGAWSIGRDAGDRRRRERELRESQEFLQHCQEIGQIGSWQSLLGSDAIVTATPEAYRIAGIPQGTTIRNGECFDLVHLDDRQLLEETLDKIHTSGNRADVELRINRSDGSLRWLFIAADAQFDPNGRLTGFIGIAQDITERKEAELRLALTALHDPLTGLPNRALFLDRVALAVARTLRNGSHIAVLFLDIDRFMSFNDVRGNYDGDALLRAMADRLQSVIRATDTVTRFGADEFGLICENVLTAATVARRVQRILTAVADPFELESGEARVTASVGVAVSESETLPTALVRDAQLAMHRAKELGGNRFELYDFALRRQVQERSDLEAALRRSLDGGELFLEFQPIRSLSEERYIGVEALVRWRHNERGVIQPNDFIPTAEESGLIVPLGRLVLEAACLQLRKWRDASPGHGTWSMSVNVAARQLHAEDFPEVVEQALEDAGVDGPSLCLELTESVLIEDGVVTDVLNRIRQLGVRIAIDDFGTKYSSLAYLTRLSVDELKIDQSFVEGMVGDESKRVVISAILAIGESLSMPVTAEGVETEAQLMELRRLGCQTVQGFYFAKPMPAERCLSFLRGDAR
jgi:diguanylate cyclase (GGDEF)-like protein/PAS domain S-box-containing protein